MYSILFKLTYKETGNEYQKQGFTNIEANVNHEVSITELHGQCESKRSE